MSEPRLDRHYVALGADNMGVNVVLRCTCGWFVLLDGFQTTPEYAWMLEQRHRRDAAIFESAIPVVHYPTREEPHDC